MATQTAWIFALALASSVQLSAAATCMPEPGVIEQADQRAGGAKEHGEDHKEPKQHRPWKFWQGESRNELGLTSQQAADIEQIFRSTLPKLEATKEKLDKLEAALSQTIKDNTADLATVAQQVDRLESTRAELQKTRTLMLYRMRGVLSAEQRAKLETIWNRRESDRRKSSDPSGRR
jgi:Spy/CpxP family protein refolding chaperone